MKVSNYEITRNRMRDEFIKYDQEKMIQKFSLKNDRQYLYLDFMGRPYRINRKNGVVEWSEDGFHSVTEGNFNESMTIYDVLCYSKDSCSLSGKFCSINMLKGIVKANPPGVNLFQKTADSFNGKVAALEKACESFGEKTDLKGDVAVKLYPFSFLPVIDPLIFFLFPILHPGRLPLCFRQYAFSLSGKKCAGLCLQDSIQPERKDLLIISCEREQRRFQE